jgi:hypothetical protein
MSWTTIVLVYAIAAAAAWWVGYQMGVARVSAPVAPVTSDPLTPLPALLAARERGYELGLEHGRNDMRGVAEAALAEFPTSLGGRAIVRALGGTVPRIERKRAGTDADGAA